MKVTFYSNFLSHHQLPFCKEMQSILGNDFRFVATESIPKERLDLGYKDIDKQYSFVLTTYDSDDNKIEAMKLCLESDVVITGSAPEIYTKERIKLNKLTFRYSERLYKKGLWRFFYPRNLVNMYKNHKRYKNKNLYMLCAGAYTASDFALAGAYKNKTYKWGYFPNIIKYDLEELFHKKESDTTKILWVGRFLGWKHPEKAILVAKKLKDEGHNYILNMIGCGEKEQRIRKLISKYRHEDNVILKGAMTPEKVREHMENMNIHLFTSDYNEGWGAVLNETMNSGCAVVASHAIGSVPFLINDGVNGLIYNNESMESLFNCVLRLVKNKELCKYLGSNAYDTMINNYTPEIATGRFINLCKEIMAGNENVYEFGVCSKAEILKQNWFQARIKNNKEI